MSDLPDDLPGVPRLTRPVPVEGLDQLLRVGRRRRSVFAATTGGVAAAVVLLITVVSLQPAASQSLQYADTDRTPPATPQPTASFVGPLPTELPTEMASPMLPSAGPRPTDGPPPDVSDSTPSAAATRESFTESPREEPAPLECRQPPSGQAGPIIYGGASACTVARSGPDPQVRRGSQVSIEIDMCNAHGSGDATLGYDTGREHEVTVYDGDGDLIYRFSRAVDYTQGAHRRTLHDGSCLVWRATWDTTRTDGELAAPGSYRVRVGVRADSVNGRRTTPGEGGYLEFPVNLE